MKKRLPLFVLLFSLFLVSCQPTVTQPVEMTTSQPAQTPQVTESGEIPTPTTNTTSEEAPPEMALNATLHEVEGSVEAKDIQENSFSTAADGRTIQKEGQVRTLDDGYTRVDLSTGTLIRMAPRSYFTLIENEPKDESLFTRIKLEAGQIWVVLNGGSLEVETPSGQASVRGSYMMVQIDPETQTAIITCLEGNCLLENPAGIVELINGQRAKFQPPELTEGDFILPSIEGMSERDFAEWLFFAPESEKIFPFLEDEELLPWDEWEEFIPEKDDTWFDLEDTFPNEPLFDGSLLPEGDGNGKIIDGEGAIINSDGTIIDAQGNIIDGDWTIINSDGTIINSDGTIIDTDGNIINGDGIIIDGGFGPFD